MYADHIVISHCVVNRHGQFRYSILVKIERLFSLSHRGSVAFDRDVTRGYDKGRGHFIQLGNQSVKRGNMIRIEMYVGYLNKGNSEESFSGVRARLKLGSLLEMLAYHWPVGE